MFKATILAMTAGAIFLLGTGNATGQPCDYPTLISVGNMLVQPCQQMRLSIPVEMSNPCPVGGFTIHIRTTEPWLAFDLADTMAADTIGGRISDWGSFTFYINPNDPASIAITALANGGPVVPEGEGTIFTLHFNFRNFDIGDTAQSIVIDTAMISDPLGYNLYDTVRRAGLFQIDHSNCEGNPRGDANCSGILNGLDVTFLLLYLKGGSSYCLLCSGDANHSGSVNGIDVSYLVNYLKGTAPPPDPCD